jgi:hypothetical protein
MSAEEGWVIDPRKPVNGFCIGFCLALINALQKLDDEDTIYVGGKDDANESVQHSTTVGLKLTRLAVTYVTLLAENINFILNGPDHLRPDEIQAVIDHAKKVLKSFRA